MKSEFKRFGLEKFGPATAVIELLGAVGLFVGLKYYFFLVVSSAGLALLMLFGLFVRIKMKDSFWLAFPALFYFLLNLFILFETLSLTNR